MSMNLLQVRTKFVELTGRYDLVVDRTNYVDNGANYFIQAGQRWLDLQMPVGDMIMRLQKDLAGGTRIINFQKCKSVKEVWICDEDGQKVKLEKKDISWLRKEYPDPITDLDLGDPAYWAEVPIALAPEQKALTSANYTAQFTHDHEDIMFADEDDATFGHWIYNGIVVYPPPESTITLEIWGVFKSVLENDTDVSFWSVNYEDVAVLAAIMSLEKHYRNTEGVKDAKSAIQDILLGIDYDAVDGEIVDISEMEG